MNFILLETSKAGFVATRAIVLLMSCGCLCTVSLYLGVVGLIVVYNSGL